MEGFVRYASQYTIVILVLTFFLLLAPQKVKVINFSRYSLSIKDIVFILLIISMLSIIINYLKK